MIKTKRDKMEYAKGRRPKKEGPKAGRMTADEYSAMTKAMDAVLPRLGSIELPVPKRPHSISGPVRHLLALGTKTQITSLIEELRAVHAMMRKEQLSEPIVLDVGALGHEVRNRP